MDLLNLGNQSRKTGLRPRANLTKDKHNMEDINEFFSDEDEEKPSDSVRRYNISNRRDEGSPLGPGSIRGKRNSRGTFTQTVTPKDNIDNVARMINFTDAEAASFNLSPISMSSKYPVKKKNKKSPLRSPLPERRDERDKEDLDVNHGFDDFGNEDQYDIPHDDQEIASEALSPVSHSPITKPMISKAEKNLHSNKVSTDGNSSSLTKRMALGKGSRKRNTGIVLDDEEDDEDSTNNLVEESSDLLSPPPTNKKPIKRRPADENTKVNIVRASPLPSPPPDGRRRSRRTKIAPLAFWRGERIVYTRAFELGQDPDTTLARDIKKIPLQEIKEVVHIPEVSVSVSNATRKRSRQKSSTTTPKKDSTYDYESDPEISGSEWFAEKGLSLSVNDNDRKTNRLVAVAPNGGDFEAPDEEFPGLDNFKIAPLFNKNQDFNATGLIDFPVGGTKSLKDSGKFIFNFHVVKGLLEVTLNNEKFVVTRGCSFQIPSKNTYGFKNIGNGASRLYFVQSEVPAIESDVSW